MMEAVLWWSCRAFWHSEKHIPHTGAGMFPSRSQDRSERMVVQSRSIRSTDIRDLLASIVAQSRRGPPD